MKHIGFRLRIPLAFLLLMVALGAAAAPRAGKVPKAEQWMTQALDAYHSGQYAPAYRCFKKAVARNPQNDGAWYYLCVLDLAVGGPQAALKPLQKALAIDPQNYWYRRLEAQLYQQMGQEERAAALYEALFAQKPGKTELLYDLTNLYLKAGRKDRAVELLDLLERREGRTEQGTLTRLSLAIEQQDSLQTAALLRAAVEEVPTPRILTLAGDYWMTQTGRQAGADSLALEAYRQALDLDPDYVPAHMGLAEAYRMRSQFDLFFAHINRFLEDPAVDLPMKLNYMSQLVDIDRFVVTFLPQVDSMFLSMDRVHSQDTAFAYFHSTFLARTDRIALTQEVLERNVENHPQDPHAHNRLLGVYYFRKDWDALCAAGERACERFPLDRTAAPDSASWAERRAMHNILAVGLWMRKDAPAALEHFHALLRHTGKQEVEELVGLHSSLGDVYYEMGNKQEAYAHYDQVLKLDPQNVPTLNNYAYYLSLDGQDLEKALKMSAYTLEQEPTNGTYLDTYGWILYLLGRYEEAKDALRKAVAYTGGERAEILSHYGDILWAMGEKALAQVKWRQALAVEPQREDLRRKVENASRP